MSRQVRRPVSSFDSRPLPSWVKWGAVSVLGLTPLALLATSLLVGPDDLAREREAVFEAAETQLAQFETGKGVSPDDPRLRRVAASIASDRPANPLLALAHWTRSVVSKPDPCDEPNLRKQLLRERLALLELEAMSRSPVAREAAATVLDRLDGNFESRRYLAFAERCGFAVKPWQARVIAARFDERIAALKGRIAQELGSQFEAMWRSKRRTTGAR
jgi:hypothetical protein